MVQPKEVVAVRTQKIALSDMPPRLYDAEAQPLPELTKKADQAEGHQEVFHLLALWVLKADDIHVQLPYDDGVPPRNQFSASSRSVRWSIVGGGRYAPMIGCPLSTGNDFTSHHVQPV